MTEIKAEYKVKTRQEVEALKQNWYQDPCWDIEETEGFEAYHDELLVYKRQCETEWERDLERREREENERIKAKADELGLVGVIRIIEQHEEQTNRIERAVEALIDGRNKYAMDILRKRE